MINTKEGLIKVHVSTLLLGFSGVFVELIPLSAPLLALGRVLISCAFLYIFIHFKKESLRLSNLQHYAFVFAGGLLLGFHWTFFNLSVQTSSVAIGTLTFASFPFFTIILEPYIYKERFLKRNIIVLALILLGVYLIVPTFSLSDNTTLGVVYGVFASFCYSILYLINRRLSSDYDSYLITFYEQFSALVFLTLYIYYIRGYELAVGGPIQFLQLIFYGLVCTALAQTLSISGQKHIRAQTASIIQTLRSVYAIVFAMLFLAEIPTENEIMGAVCIVVAVLFASVMENYDGFEKIKRRFRKDD